MNQSSTTQWWLLRANQLLLSTHNTHADKQSLFIASHIKPHSRWIASLESTYQRHDDPITLAAHKADVESSFMPVEWFTVRHKCVVMFVWKLTSVRVSYLEANSNYFYPFIGQCITHTPGLLAPVRWQQSVHGLYQLDVFSVKHTQNNCVCFLMECMSSAVQCHWYLSLKTNKDFRTKAKPKQRPRLASGQAVLKV